MMPIVGSAARTSAITSLALLGCLTVAGCVDSTYSGQSWESSSSISRAGTSSDVMRVLALYEKSPWLMEPDADLPTPVGIRVSSLYLVSGRSEKGVFGDGTIRFVLQTAERKGPRTRRGAKLCEWTFDRDRAVDWRVTQRSWMGRGYQFDLPWPDGVDPRGQSIALTVEYVRTDGKTVRSNPKFLKVPTEL